jgi:hypothetical protein
MLGFHAVGSRAVCAGRGIFLRSTGTLVSSSMGSVSVTAKGWRLTSVAAAVGPAGIEQSTSTRRGTEVASAASLGFVSGLVLSTRHTSAAAGTASGVEAFGIGIRVTSFVAQCGGLAGVAVLPIYLGRPGMQWPGDPQRYGYERDGQGVALVLQRPADDSSVPSSRPPASSEVPASRAPSATDRATSRKASGASASTQRSASSTGPALRSADSSNDPGKQR